MKKTTCDFCGQDAHGEILYTSPTAFIYEFVNKKHYDICSECFNLIISTLDKIQVTGYKGKRNIERQIETANKENDEYRRQLVHSQRSREQD